MSGKIEIPETKYAKYMDIFCRLMLAAAFLFIIWMWGRLPSRIPIHYNGAGDVDGWGSKWSIWFLYIMSLVLYGGVTLVERHPEIWNTGVTVTRKNKDSVYLLIKHLIVTVKASSTLIFSYLSIWTVTGKGLGAWFTPVSLIIVFGPMAYYLVRLVRLPK